MKWRNSKERELLANGGSREQTLPNKNNPHPDLSDAESDKPKIDLSDVSPLNSPLGITTTTTSGFPPTTTSFSKSTSGGRNSSNNNTSNHQKDNGGSVGGGAPNNTMDTSMEDMGHSADSSSSSPAGPLSPYSIQQQQQLHRHHLHHHYHQNSTHFRSRSSSPVDVPTDLSSGNEREDEEISVI